MNCEKCSSVHDGTYGSGRFCSVKCSRSFATSSRRKDISLKVSKTLKGKPTWSKGLKLVAREIRMCKLVSCFNTFEVKHHANKEYCSVQCHPNIGGYRKGSGRGISGWYKGIFCDSSWELAYVLWCRDKGKNIKRNTERFDYEYNGKAHQYLPDFLVDGELVEIKGYTTARWRAKLDHFPKHRKLSVLYKKDMYPYLEYAESTYGNFVDLYEEKKLAS